MRSQLDHLLEGRSYRVAAILGSGLSDLARSLVAEAPISYAKIDGMPVATVAGHEGALYAGHVNGIPTLVFAGRAHLYEGHDAATVTFPVRAAVASGCEVVIVTNAAGAIDESLEIGAPCLISDHLNLTGVSPLTGPPEEGRERFLDLTEVYDGGLRALAREIDSELAEGVYAGMAGPTYETPAEIRMLKTLGADLVGMSTVLEAIMARHLGARVLGISVVSNLAAGLSPEPLTHDEVAAAGARALPRLEKLVRGVIERL
ncbi:MAG: purine-nucleoside phosphorylase [Actinomycetota bacterium]